MAHHKYLLLTALLLTSCSRFNKDNHLRISDGIKPPNLVIHGDTAYYANDTAAIASVRRHGSDTTKHKDFAGDSLVNEPKLLERVIPKYPYEALPITGSTFVKVWVRKNGLPRLAIVTESPNSLLNERSLIAAMECRFEPAMTAKGPVSVWITFPYNFKLK